MPTAIELSKDLQDFLASIKVVLVNTTLPANIGSTARAMYTMGLHELVVVNPKHPLDEDAIAHAAGASQILQNAITCETLEMAIADCHWVLAASSRQRHMPKLVITPRQAVQLMLAQFNQTKLQVSSITNNPFKVALVFGREDRGLTNEELQLADYHVQIPANPAYGVLNVAAAVQVIASVFFEQASEFFMPQMTNNFSHTPSMNAMPTITANEDIADLPNKTVNEITYFIRQTWDERPITHDQQQQLRANLLSLLTHLELYHPDQPKMLPYRLARLVHRLQLDVKEYELIQASLAKIERQILK